MSGVEKFLGQIRRTLEDGRSQATGGPALLAKFDRCFSSLDDLESSLAELQEWVVLRVDSGLDEMINLARKRWAEIPADRDYQDVTDIVKRSPTLSALYQASVDVRSMRRFGPEALKVADAIGRHSAKWPHYARLLVDKRDDPEFGISPEAVRPMSELIKVLERDCNATGFTIQGSVKGQHGRPYWRDHTRIQKGREVTRWRIVRGQIDPQWRGLFQGHWLTAFAYGIAEDQFTRAAAPFEIYSNVKYEIPSDLGGGASDIDVLVRTANVLLCIECKSGRVLHEHKGGDLPAAARAARAASQLDEVFNRMGLDLERVYQLTYLSDETESDVLAVTGREGASIQAVRPDHLRPTIQSIASRAAIGTKA